LELQVDSIFIILSQPLPSRYLEGVVKNAAMAADTASKPKYHELDPSGDVILVLDLEEEVIAEGGEGQAKDRARLDPTENRIETNLKMLSISILRQKLLHHLRQNYQ
jgi:hypothetical protein